MGNHLTNRFFLFFYHVLRAKLFGDANPPAFAIHIEGAPQGLLSSKFRNHENTMIQLLYNLELYNVLQYFLNKLYRFLEQLFKEIAIRIPPLAFIFSLALFAFLFGFAFVVVFLFKIFPPSRAMFAFLFGFAFVVVFLFKISPPFFKAPSKTGCLKTRFRKRIFG